MRSGLRAIVLMLALGGCRQLFGLEDPSTSTADAADTNGDSGANGDATTAVPTLEFLGMTTSTTDTSMFTFPQVPIGTPAADRHVIVIAHFRAPTAYGASTLAIAGGTTNKLGVAGESGSGASTAVFLAQVPPTATTADIMLSYTGGTNDRRAGIAVWAAYGLASTTPHDVEVFLVDNTNPGQVVLDVPAGGLFVAGVAMSSVVGGTTSAWTGLAEDYNQIVETASLFAGGSGSGVPAGTYTLTHSCSDTTTSQRVVAVSFR